MGDNPKYETVVEEYIEIVGDLLAENPVARVKDIAAARGVTLPTASNAVEKLKNLGLVEHEHYSYVTLTESGWKLAQELEHSHNVIKELMVNLLGVPEEVAETDACKIEHHISGQTIDGMKNLLFFAKNCPYKNDDWLELIQKCGLFEEGENSCRECLPLRNDKNQRKIAD